MPFAIFMIRLKYIVCIFLFILFCSGQFQRASKEQCILSSWWLKRESYEVILFKDQKKKLSRKMLCRLFSRKMGESSTNLLKMKIRLLWFLLLKVRSAIVRQCENTPRHAQYFLCMSYKLKTFIYAWEDWFLYILSFSCCPWRVILLIHAILESPDP